MARFCFGEFLKIITEHIADSAGGQEAAANLILTPLLNDKYLEKDQVSKLRNQKISVNRDITANANELRDDVHMSSLLCSE